jgi:RNA polymerase sigma-70 factor (ECF subfamily)
MTALSMELPTWTGAGKRPPRAPGAAGASAARAGPDDRDGAGGAELDALLQSNAGWLRGWLAARLRGRGAQDVDDLFQETVLRAVRGFRKLRRKDRFAAWLYRIAGNVLRDHVRRRARGPAMVALEAEPPAAAPGGLEETEELGRAVAALLELPAKYREPMLLRHVRDLDYAGIAAILGITENAVQVRIFRARQKLVAALEDGAARRQPSASGKEASP